MNNSIKKCCICDNSKTGQFITIKDEKYHLSCIESLNKENEKLKKQLEYLRSGEYLNQLKFENKMLQDVVDNIEVSSEDKTFIDCTCRNTELLEQQKEFIEWLEQNKENEEYCYLAVDKKDRVRWDIFNEVLTKYKEISGFENE